MAQKLARSIPPFVRRMDVANVPLIFVCGHRKAGTTLLRNLLDGHEQLAVYPNDLALLYAYFPDWIRTQVEPDKRRARLERILFSDLADLLRKNNVGDDFDVQVLAERFFLGLSDDDLGDLGAIIARLRASYLEVTGCLRASIKATVLKETSIEIYASEILGWFREARFVQVLRDPRDNFAALAAGVDKHYTRLGEDRNRTLASLVHRARHGLRMAVRNRVLLGDERYHLLRFEDLVAAPEIRMRELAAFIGIDFRPSLLVPMLLGKPVAANSYESGASFAVNAHNAGRWRERITPEEAQVIEFHLGDEMQAFGYEPAFSAAEQTRAAAEFYKWQNYAYFYRDRFAEPQP
jgi:hypothetical protein